MLRFWYTPPVLPCNKASLNYRVVSPPALCDRVWDQCGCTYLFPLWSLTPLRFKLAVIDRGDPASQRGLRLPRVYLPYIAGI